MARLDEALGEGREALSPLPPAPPRWVRRSFAEPIATAERYRRRDPSLARGTVPPPRRGSAGRAAACATLHRVDGESVRLAVGTARPSRDVAHLLRLFAERHRTDRSRPRHRGHGAGGENGRAVGGAATRSFVFPPPLRGNGRAAAGCECVGKAALCLTPHPSPARGEGVVIFDDDTSHADRPAGEPAGARGRSGVWCRTTAHLPERAQRFVFAFAPVRPQPRGSAGRGPVRLLVAARADRGGGAGARRSAADVPLAPAAAIDVARAEGPERIMGEWWRGAREAELLRDYYRVEDADGRRYWLFRAGLYRPETRGALVPARALRMTRYAELQCTSNFSFLRGASHPHELVEQAQRARPSRHRHRRPQHAGRHRPRPCRRARRAKKACAVRFVVGCRLDYRRCFPSPLEGEGESRAERGISGGGYDRHRYPPPGSRSSTPLKGRGEKQMQSCEASVG